MVRAPDPDKIPINSPHNLHVEVELLVAALQLNETEDTWEKINRAVKRFQATVRGGACRFQDDFVHHMRDPRVAKGIVRSLVTERTALSGTTLELVASCTRLGPHFAALLSLYLPTLLRLFARPNKVYVTRSASCIASIIRNTRLADVVRFIALEWRNEPGKSASFREQAATALAIALGADGDALTVDKEGLERRIDDLEWLIKTGATGREAGVRAEMKKCWEVYKREWPERVASCVLSLPSCVSFPLQPLTGLPTCICPCPLPFPQLHRSHDADHPQVPQSQ
ncbi:clasp N terminal-domain-containing protein [Rhodotorula diobovata]|uniref:Clasp N terminal-domain-containing protein n=1 Tax=Rhodotorula diobovata TaxID=5288 RepID=A0A5C5G5H1_9BASI|nr:clasp N terminal-domain-containing protein [Rhodotorula diobovata]